MAFETLGINFVLKGVTQAAQNWSYMAGAIMRFGSQYARIEAQIKKYYGAENNLVQKSINYWTRYWVMLQKNIDKTVISIGTLQAKILAYSNAHISMTARQTVIYAKMQSNLSDLIDKVVDLKDEQVNASDIVTDELSKQNIIYDKLQQKLNELSNPISAFFSMLTGGWAKGILEGTQFGTMLMKLVPSAVAISVALDVVKLAVDAIAYAIKFGQALWNWLWNIIGKVTSAAWNLAKSVLKYLADVIVDVGKKVVTWLVDKFKAFISLPFRIANDALGSLVNMFKQIFAVTAGVSLDRILNNVATAIKNVGARAWTAAVDFQSLKLRLQGLLQREISEGQTTKVPVIKNIIPSGAQLEALDNLNQKLSILQDKVTIAQQNFAKKGTLQTKVALDSAKMSVEAMEKKISALSSGMSGTYTVMEKLTTGTMSFAQALPMAKKQVIELTEWISDWAMKTKFNAVTIANAFTLAMSYGFGSEGAKKLIVDISQFTTGMGLGNEEFTRIIENFGQMIQQGKLTGTELRDLARGAFMPINKILGIMGENLGLDNLQIGEMKKQIQSMTSEGEIDLNQFFTAFGQMVGVDFPDAVATMQASWAVMQSNLKEDFVEAIIGWRVITPIVDKIGERLNVLVNQLITPQMKQMWSEFGENLAFVVDQFMTLFDTLTGGSGSRIITWMGNFVTRINNVIGVYRKIIDNNIVKTWGRKTAIYMLLDALGISDPSRSIGNAIDKTITKIQDLWTAISNSPTVLGKSQILLDFFNKEILPVITDWFTNVLFPGIKNLITTYGPGIISTLTGEVILALDTIGSWFGTNSKPDSVFGQFLTLVKSIMTYLGASATEAIVPQTPLFAGELHPQNPEFGKTGGTESSGAKNNMIASFNKLKDSLIALANEGIAKVTEKFNEFIKDVIPRIDTWLSTVQTPWGNLRDILGTVWKTLSDLFAGLLKVDFKTLGEDIVILVVPLIDLGAALLGIPTGSKNLADWGLEFNKFIDDITPKILAIERVASVIMSLARSLFALARMAAVIVNFPTLLITSLATKDWTVFTSSWKSLMDSNEWMGEDALDKSFGKIKEQAANAGSEAATNFISAFSSPFSAFTGQANNLGLVWGSTERPVSAEMTSMFTLGTDMIKGLQSGIDTQMVEAQKAWTERHKFFYSDAAAYYGTQSPSTLMNTLGVDLVLGLWNGMKSEFALLKAWWDVAIAELSASISKIMMETSPSKVMAKHGKNIMLGLAEGIQGAGNTPFFAMRNTPLFAYARGGGNTANNTYITNKNYNLGGVNTTRPSTSVIRDFELMRLME